MLMPLIRFLTVALAVFLPFLEEAQAGVTIHYEGRAESAAAVDGALRMLTSRAHALGWKVDDAFFGSLPELALEHCAEAKISVYCSVYISLIKKHKI